ncbi:hypothetical protein ACLOJK_021650 [Asimina triloba]
MMSPNKVSILCRYGDNFVEEFDKVSYKDDTKYKHPELGLDCLISIENDEDLCSMMFETQNNAQRLCSFSLFLISFFGNLTLSGDKENVKETKENHRGNKEMSLQPNSDMDINVETAGMPTDGLQLGMDHELRMDNHNLASNDGAEYGCANEMVRSRRGRGWI